MAFIFFILGVVFGAIGVLLLVGLMISARKGDQANATIRYSPFDASPFDT
jgi:hypothetical protein